MKKLSVIFSALFVLLFLFGCSEQDINSPEMTSQQNTGGNDELETLQSFEKEGVEFFQSFEHPVERRSRFNNNFKAFLTGASEVPEPVETDASGLAVFHFSHDLSRLFIKIFVANIENVFMAHIHLAPAGENGPVILWLYPDNPPSEEIPGSFTGVLIKDFDTEEDLVGPLEGMTLGDLKETIQAGNAYVNVHTTQNPAGEIRGQIMPVHPIARMAKYRIEIENLTPATGMGSSQPLSPPVMATHTPFFRIFRLGTFASDELEQVAEDAINEPLVNKLKNSRHVFDVVTGDAPIPPQSSASFTIESRFRFMKLSLVSMLVNTNDTFTGANGLMLPLFGARVYTLKSYDSGTEKNTELEAHIPGPCCGNPMMGEDEQQRITFSPGILGVGDLDPDLYDWDEPTARLIITRMH